MRGRPQREAMTHSERAWTDLPCANASANGEGPRALGIPQRIEGQGQQAPGERDPGDLRPPAGRDPLGPEAQLRIAGRAHRGLDHDPAQPARALLGDVPPLGVLVARALGRGEPGPAAELIGRTEPVDRANLGQDGDGGDEADPRDREELADPGVAGEDRTELAVEEFDLGRARVDEPQRGIDPAAADRRQREGRKVLPPCLAEERVHRRVDALLGDEGVDLATQPGADPDQRGPGSDQPSALADLGWGDSSLPGQVRAQQVREGPGVDRVVLDLPAEIAFVAKG